MTECLWTSIKHRQFESKVKYDVIMKRSLKKKQNHYVDVSLKSKRTGWV